MRQHIRTTMLIIVAAVVAVVGACLLAAGPASSEIFARFSLITGGYVFTVASSGFVFGVFVGEPSEGDEAELPHKNTPSGYTTGAVIGKCENILTLTLILLGGYTGLAVIFAAKPIARADQIKAHPEYYLAGTLVNFTYSVLIGVLLRFALGL